MKSKIILKKKHKKIGPKIALSFITDADVELKLSETREILTPEARDTTAIEKESVSFFYKQQKTRFLSGFFGISDDSFASSALTIQV